MKTLLLALVLLTNFAMATPTALTVVTTSETAANLAANSADTSNGNSVANPSGQVFLMLYNVSSTTPASVVITPSVASAVVPGYGLMTKSTPTIYVASSTASSGMVVGPFPSNLWNDSSGNLQLTYTGAASTSIRVSPLKIQ